VPGEASITRARISEQMEPRERFHLLGNRSSPPFRPFSPFLSTSPFFTTPPLLFV
jgi:hypothetical protein